MEPSADLVGAALVAVVALGCGFAVHRVARSAVGAYVAVGLICGPNLLGFFADRSTLDAAAPFAAVFAVSVLGTSLALRRAPSAWRIALGIAIATAIVMTAVVAIGSLVLAYKSSQSVALGLILATTGGLAVLSLLAEQHQSATRAARLARSALLVQALALPIYVEIGDWFGGHGIGLGSLVACLIYIAVAAALVAVLGARTQPSLPAARMLLATIGPSPLVPLFYGLLAAAVFGALGLSIAFGALVGGIILANCAERHDLTRATATLRDLATPVFFVMLGLLVDLRFVLDNLLTTIVIVALATLGRMAMLIAAHRMMGEDWRHSYVHGLMLTPSGELGFVALVALSSQGAIESNVAKLAIAAIALNVMIVPILGTMVRRILTAPEHAGTDWRTLRDVAMGPSAAVLAQSTVGRIYPRTPTRPTAPEPPTETTMAEIGDKVRAAAGMPEAPSAPPECNAPDAKPPAAKPPSDA